MASEVGAQPVGTTRGEARGAAEPDRGGVLRRRRWADIGLNELDVEDGSCLAWSTFPVTPMDGASTSSSSDAKGRKASSEVPRIGIDIGGVVTRTRLRDNDLSVNWGTEDEAPGAFDGFRRLVEIFGEDNVFLVSKFKIGDPMQRKTEHWLHETCKFCERTGVLRKNIVFCSPAYGRDGRGVVAERLRLSHFVDDSLEGLSLVFAGSAGNSGHWIEQLNGLLLHLVPARAEGKSVDTTPVEVPPRMRPFYRCARDWQEVIAALGASSDTQGTSTNPSLTVASRTAGGDDQVPYGVSQNAAVSSGGGCDGDSAYSSIARAADGRVSLGEGRRSERTSPAVGSWSSNPSGGGGAGGGGDSGRPAHVDGTAVKGKRRGTRGGAKNRSGGGGSAAVVSAAVASAATATATVAATKAVSVGGGDAAGAVQGGARHVAPGGASAAHASQPQQDQRLQHERVHQQHEHQSRQTHHRSARAPGKQENEQQVESRSSSSGVTQPASCGMGEVTNQGRKQLQLKPRSSALGAVGGKAEVSDRTAHLFGRV
eukprot:TRINITY_DN4170_c0_g4_i1.p1 TRINITY_DN4170_c0_g4~~TRINITY_DN4170_c0_g4_i1.p1  ORF type:complete len:578 (-),score=102.48 TRINITY_DN4170_c0_g4_i1:46-1665(-)